MMMEQYQIHFGVEIKPDIVNQIYITNIIKQSNHLNSLLSFYQSNNVELCKLGTMACVDYN